MLFGDLDISAEYIESLGENSPSKWSEPQACWIKYDSESNELSIKLECEEEWNKPDIYIRFEGILNSMFYPYSIELESSPLNRRKESMWLEMTYYDENWHFEGLVDTFYTEKVNGKLVKKTEQRMIIINQVDPWESELYF